MPSPGKVVGAVLIGIGVAIALFTFYVAYTQCFWYAAQEKNYVDFKLTFGKWGPALGFLCLMAAIGIAFAKIGMDALRFTPPPVEQAPPTPALPPKPAPLTPKPALAPPTAISEAPKPPSPPPSPPQPPAVERRPSPPPRPAVRPVAPSPPSEAPSRSTSEALRATFPPPPRIREEDLLPPPPSERKERPSPPGPPRREAGSMELKPEGETDLRTIIELLRRKRQERRRS